MCTWSLQRQTVEQTEKYDGDLGSPCLKPHRVSERLVELLFLGEKYEELKEEMRVNSHNASLVIHANCMPQVHGNSTSDSRNKWLNTIS